MEEKELIHVHVVEGTVYQCKPHESPVTVTQEQWDSLDLKQPYRIEADKVVLKNQEPPQAPQKMPPFSLDMMYVQAGVGEAQRLEALWDVFVNQDRTKVDHIITKRLEVDQEYRRQMELYEAGK